MTANLVFERHSGLFDGMGLPRTYAEQFVQDGMKEVL